MCLCFLQLCTCLTLYCEGTVRDTLCGVRSVSTRIMCVCVTCVVVPMTVCGPGSLLVEAQAVGCDRGRPVVAQRGWTTSAAVHILHVHAAVTAGQVVLTHPAEHTHTHTQSTDLLIHIYISVRDTNWQGAIKNLESLDYSSWLTTHTHKCALRGGEMLHNCASICDTHLCSLPLKLVKCAPAEEAWLVLSAPQLLSEIKTTPLTQGRWNRINNLI